MNAFEKVIGYDSVKREVERVCDIIKNGDKYKKLGVKIPSGMLLYGAPGVGKTLISNCLIEESGRKVFVCRKNLPKSEFIKFIKDTFEQAKNNTPSIVFLDDFDKFANEDEGHKNAEEFVTIQSCIDEIKDKDVFVIATANLLGSVPESLLRAGRFDITIEVEKPAGEDAENIIRHYLKTKTYVADIDFHELARILCGSSCAELENIINQAGIYAGFENKEKIDFDDIIRASIRSVYDAPETIRNICYNYIGEEVVAYHEAGHAVVAEVLEPNTVTMISVGGHEGSIGGFTSYYRDKTYWLSLEPMKNRVMCLLAGKCAIEVKYGKVDVGAVDDIERASEVVKRIITAYASLGFDKCDARLFRASDALQNYQERAITDELTRFYQQTKEILVQNREFLDKLASKLQEKKFLISKDIQKIKEELSL